MTRPRTSTGSESTGPSSNRSPKGSIPYEVDQETAEEIDANYRQNHARLVRVKNRYDPTNLFRLIANMQPTV